MNMMRAPNPYSPDQPAWHGSFTFPADDPIYADHFPHAPVVPGTLIIHAFRQEATRRGWQASGIRAFRFRHFVTPGTYAFTLTPTEYGLRCTLTRTDEIGNAGKPLATGELAASPARQSERCSRQNDMPAHNVRKNREEAHAHD
jgi:3-hydroxyacyl-[acyl-carrier-protein] dehydratase